MSPPRLQGRDRGTTKKENTPKPVVTRGRGSPGAPRRGKGDQDLRPYAAAWAEPPRSRDLHNPQT